MLMSQSTYGEIFYYISLIRWACFILAPGCAGCPQTLAPGFIGVNASGNAAFTWCIGTDQWDAGDIYFNTKLIAATSFGSVTVFDNDFMNHIQYQETSSLCAGFLLTDVKETFAGAYTVELSGCSLEGATLYLYKKPGKASLKASEPNHEGIQFTLECKATSTSLRATDRPEVNMVYAWHNNSDDLNPADLPERYSITSGGDPANAVNDLLVISELSRHDAGSYTCYGHENGSSLISESSNKYILTPLHAPGGASAGGDHIVKTGDDITLFCSGGDRGRPDGSWIWTTPGGPEVNTSDADQLTITSVTVMSDDGEYSCRLNNQVGDGARGFVTVTVQEMPSLEVIKDVVLTNNQSLNVSCKAKARPESNVTWKYADGSSLPSSIFTWTSLPRSDGKYTVTTSYLQWTAGSSPDDRRHKGGGITCVASNVVDDATTDFMLDVQFAPYNVQVNTSAEIIEYESLGPVLCSAVCNPPCTYNWSKAGAQVSSNAELMIPNVTRDDHGVYECRPENGIAGGQTTHFNLTVLYGPSVNTFEVLTSSGPINQTDDVSFSCQTDSRPAPVITLIRPSGDTLVSSSTSNILEHTLTDVDCLDSGVYRCVAKNSKTQRNDHKPLSIAVQCPPRKHSTSDVKVGATEGDTVAFSITAIATPQPTFMWFFNGTQLPDQSYSTMTSYSQEFVPAVYVNSTLTLSNVTQEDFGNYSVTASNPLGAMEDVVYSLIPAGPPVAPSQLLLNHANAVSITMQWASGWKRGGEQVFTLLYRRSDSDDSYTNITDISDPGQGETVRAKARNLTSDSSYDFIVVAENKYGPSQSQLASEATAASLDFGSENNNDFPIVISGDMATITWSLHSYSGPITHVNVTSCVSDSTNCIPTKVIPITSTVEVRIPEGGSSYMFEFLVYDGEDLLVKVNRSAKVGTRSPVGIIVGVLVAVVVLVAAAVVIFTIWRRKSQADTRKGQNNGSELGHVNPVMVTDDDISLTTNGKHDAMSEGHQMVVENTLYASSGPGRDDHMDQPYSEVPVVTGNMVVGAKAPGKKNKPKGKKGKGKAVEMSNLYTESDNTKGKLPIEDTISPYEDVDGTDKLKGAGPVDSLLPEYAEVDRSQKPKKAYHHEGSAAPQLAEYADLNVVKKNKHAKKPNRSDIVQPEVVEYEEVDFKKKSPGASAAAAGGRVAMGAAALPEYGQVDLSKKHKQGKAAKLPQVEEYAQVDFSKKIKKESDVAGKDKPPVKGKKPKPGAPPPRPPRAASVDERERAQSPPDHQPQYGIEGTLYADLDLINTAPTRTEPTVHANLEPSEYASIDALRLTTRPADQ